MENQGAAEMEIPQEPVAKESWVNAYMEGNRLWPQDHFPGISYITLSAVLKDPPTSWETFYDSKMTKKQVDDSATTMSRMHHRAGIQMATEEHKKPGDEVISQYRVSGIWEQAKKNVILTAFRYVNSIQPSQDGLGTKIHLMPAELDKFFADQTNEGAIERLKDIMEIVEEELRSPEGKDFAKTHRESIQNHAFNRKLDEDIEESNVVLRPLRKIASQGLRRFHAPIKLAGKIMNNRLKERVHGVYPDEDLQWMKASVGDKDPQDLPYR